MTHCPIPPLPPAEPQHGDHTTLAPLYVVTMISNPVRSNVRVQLYKEYAQRLASAGAILHTVEIAFGARPFTITESGNPRHHQFRTRDELWHKENGLNLGFSRLPEEADYIAWIDADIAFTNPHWVNETIQQLQHFPMVQMFTHAVDQGPNYQPFAQHRGFIYGWRQNPGANPDPGMAYNKPEQFKCGSMYHPGFAWAARKWALDQLGGLYDTAVMGSADTYMARGLVGRVEGAMGEAKRGLTHAYNHSIEIWQARAKRILSLNIGYVDGTILHYWHGKKKDRQYFDRNKVMIDAKFDPGEDLVRDTRGVLHLGSNNIRLRDGLRAYFRNRQEDSIDM